MNTPLRLILAAFFLAGLAPAWLPAADLPKEIPLWPEGVPGIKADTSDETVSGTTYTHTHHPVMFYHAPKAGTANGTAVIFAPGGGYVHVNIGGPEFTQWLLDDGVAVFILIYRNQDYGHPAPLQDMLRAVRLLRSRAADYGLNPGRIGAIGNSAGSHLVASAGTLFDAPEGKTGSPLDAVSGRPDFMILTFPVLTFEPPYGSAPSRRALIGANPSPDLVAHLSLEKQVTKDTPPTFLVHTMQDTSVPVENTVMFYEALLKAGVPAEMHLYEKGTHGSGLSPNFGQTAEWPLRCAEWMRAHGWIPPLAGGKGS
jgi:acetyl esterase/lipase